MSWNKNTIYSKVYDTIVSEWKKNGDVVVEATCPVPVYGLNDIDDTYRLRIAVNKTRAKLIYEFILRTDDCDTPDFVNAKIVDLDRNLLTEEE